MDGTSLQGPINFVLFVFIFLPMTITNSETNIQSFPDLFRSLADDPNFQELYLQNSDITIEINNSSTSKDDDGKVRVEKDQLSSTNNFENLTDSERLFRIEKLLTEIKAQHDHTTFVLNDMQNFIFGPLAWMCSENVKTEPEEKPKQEISTPDPQENSDLPMYRYSTEFDNRFIRLMNWIKENISQNKSKKGEDFIDLVG